jgi:hypothetical protein
MFGCIHGGAPESGNRESKAEHPKGDEVPEARRFGRPARTSGDEADEMGRVSNVAGQHESEMLTFSGGESISDDHLKMDRASKEQKPSRDFAGDRWKTNAIDSGRRFEQDGTLPKQAARSPSPLTTMAQCAEVRRNRRHHPLGPVDVCPIVDRRFVLAANQAGRKDLEVRGFPLAHPHQTGARLAAASSPALDQRLTALPHAECAAVLDKPCDPQTL